MPHPEPFARTEVAALVIGHLELRPAEFQVLVGGRRAGLTVREFEILLVLARRHDRVVRRAEIYNEVWGGQMPHRDRSVDVFVRKVRGKLAAISPDWTYVHTHFGIGYRFAPEPGAPHIDDDTSSHPPPGAPHIDDDASGDPPPVALPPA